MPTSTHYLPARLLAVVGALALMSFARPAAADAPNPTWEERYSRARSEFIAGHEAEAALVFDQLALEAANAEDARRASELAQLCRSKLSLDADLAHLRTPQELTILYATAFVYGLGTSAWVALLTEPKNLGGAILPFAVLTTASVGGVALADGYRPFRRGVPQSIASGVYLGFGEGIWAVGIQHAGAARRDDGSAWTSKQVASMLWAGATLGGIGGGLIGAARQPTPGRVSFTLSTSLWGGLISSFGAAAITSNDSKRTEQSFTSGLIGYNVGLASGLLFAPSISPSVARVRFVDLGAIGGGLVGAGAYSLAAGSGNARAGFGASSIGAALGLGLTWWATSSMPSDPPAATGRSLAWMPGLVHRPDGWLATVSGEL